MTVAFPAQTTASAPHRPLRRCVVCRRSAAKAELGRIARTPVGEVVLGAVDGRGAYVCRGGPCADALRSDPRPLARALRINIEPEHLDAIIRAYGPGQETA